MGMPACPEDEFIRIWQELKSAKLVAQALAIDIRSAHRRRKAIEYRKNIILEANFFSRL